MNLDLTTEERLAQASPDTIKWMDSYRAAWDRDWALGLFADAAERNAQRSSERVLEAERARLRHDAGLGVAGMGSGRDRAPKAKERPSGDDWREAQAVVVFMGYPDKPDISVSSSGSIWVRSGTQALKAVRLLEAEMTKLNAKVKELELENEYLRNRVYDLEYELAYR